METDFDAIWAQLTERGALRACHADLDGAAGDWEEAARAAEAFDDTDPRRAATLNNRAVAAHLAGRREEAGRLYREALQAWKDARRWVEQMELVPRARSSLFHLRMEVKHREHYRRLALSEYFALLPAGCAAVLNNQALWHWAGGDKRNAESLYETALRGRCTAFGESERGATIIRDNLAAAGDDRNGGHVDAPADMGAWAPVLDEPFAVRAEREGWLIDWPAELTDEGRVMAALTCTCLIGRALGRSRQHPSLSLKGDETRA